MAVVQLLFTVLVLDAGGNVLQLDPPVLSEDFLAAVDNASFIKYLIWDLMKVMEENL